MKTYHFVIKGSKFCQILNEPSKNCQRLIILPKWQNFSTFGHAVCDHIWRNFASLTKFQNSWRSIEGLFSIWQNFKPTLAINFWPK